MSTASPLDDLYPPGPAAAPPDLAQATRAYKQRAWLAMAGLALFMLLYLALSGWFAWTAYRLVAGTHGSFTFEGVLVGLGAAFLAVFMLKALFFVKHGWDVEDREVTREQQPRLFAFIDRLADEAGAPRAHRVFLSSRVNAAVFYDLSLLNLIVPSKKNLEIGLGLVNVLTLSQLKAVLAHEFGHFAQRSMAVGRWVYVAQQIAAQIIGKRDILDRFLQQLSRIDFRIAWVGWILSLTVWSIRSLMEIVFRGVVLAQRALGRQMEFQADLVSVSLAGSDELIHALHGLNAADDAWDRTLRFAGTEAGAGRAIADLFAVQTRIIERLREILDEADYGVAPPLPEQGREDHRLFKAQLAQPPRMWASHPPNTEREQNAKRVYVAAPLDGRSAWALFEDPAALRAELSAHVLRSVKAAPAPLDETLARLDALYARASLDRAYRGLYLGRQVTRHAPTAAALVGEPPAAGAALEALDALYPESLAADVEQLSELCDEKSALEALRAQAAVAPGGIIRHRGEELRRSALPAAIERVGAEIAELEHRLHAHDARCRSVHLACAEAVGRGWPEYLRGLLGALHFAEHREADLADARAQLGNLVAVATADGRVTEGERNRLLRVSGELHRLLAQIHAQGAHVALDPALLERLGEVSFSAALGKFELPAPSKEQLGEWLGVIDSWVDAVLGGLGELREAALDQLLASERRVAAFARGSAAAEDAPTAPSVGAEYPAFPPDRERPRAQLSWWDRFQTADGAFPTVARLSSAAAIVGGVIAFSAAVGDAVVTVYNGLARDVVVDVGGQRLSLAPLGHATARVAPDQALHLAAATREGAPIEAFDTKLEGSFGSYVYNVAGAAPLYVWTAVYGGSGQAPPQRMLGSPRWSTTSADHVFEEPPEEVRSKGVERRDVLASIAELQPQVQVGNLSSDDERRQLIASHARWDRTDSPHILEWLALGKDDDERLKEILAERLRDTPDDAVLLRLEQDLAGPEREAVCARHRAAAERQAAAPVWRYLALRCMPDGPEQNEAFLAAHRELPESGWIAMAAGWVLAGRGDYEQAERLLGQARSSEPALRAQLGDELARIRRLASAGAPVRLDDLLQGDDRLRVLVAIETGATDVSANLAPYQMLARGELTQVVEAARKLGADGRVLRILAAASDGASPELAEPELLAPAADDGLGELLAGYGLAARAGRDTAAHVRALGERLGSQGAPVLEFLERAGREPDALARLAGTDVQMRALALSTAVVALGPKAPADWRDYAKRGAFVGERPYFR